MYKTIKQVSEEMKLKDFSIRQAIRQGQVEYSYFAGKYFVDEDSMRNLVESRKNTVSPKGRKPR